jgi:hypothetical protein
LEYICEHCDGYFVRNPVSHCEKGFQVLPATNEIVGQFHHALAGLFVKSKMETTAIANRQPPIPNHQPTISNHQAPMLSLYFLVPGKSIDPFRRVIRQMRSRMESTKLLLTGPWPPYNFVLPDNEKLLGPSSPTKLEKNQER